MGNRWEKSGNSVRLYFLSSKITAGGDCSHEIKRHLLLGRKVITKLDSILKSRDITLPTKVHIVKAIVFPVVMYRCESCTIKKAECQRIDAFYIYIVKCILIANLWEQHRRQTALKTCTCTQDNSEKYSEWMESTV